MKRVAVFGTGSIGSRHLRLLKTIENVEPVAVSVRTERANELHAEGYCVAPDLATAAKMGCESVVIATDTARHAADLEQSLELNLRVLVEKPLACTFQESYRVIENAERKGKSVFTANCLRFDATIQFAAEWVLQRCGPLRYSKIWCHSFLPSWRAGRGYKDSYSADAQQGGVLRDLIHEIDLSLLMLGPVKSVVARTWNTGVLGIQSEEAAVLILEHYQGEISTLNLDYISQPSRRGGIVCGRNGSVEWNLVVGSVTWVPNTGAAETKTFQESPDEKYHRQLEAFLGGSEQASRWLATGRTGLEAVRVIDAARQSNMDRKYVELGVR